MVTVEAEVAGVVRLPLRLAVAAAVVQDVAAAAGLPRVNAAAVRISRQVLDRAAMGRARASGRAVGKEFEAAGMAGVRGSAAGMAVGRRPGVVIPDDGLETAIDAAAPVSTRGQVGV